MRRIFRQLSTFTTSWRTFAELHLPFRHPTLKRSWSILYWMPTGIVLTQYFCTAKVITGRSMQPTLNPDSSLWRDVAIFDRYSVHTLHRYNRGDVVALKSPEDPKHMLVKRIIALEGDTVRTLPPYPDLEIRVPQGHIWIEGDEPFHSIDSNTFGPVPLALVDCKLVLIIWPFQRFGLLRRPSLPTAKSGNASRFEMAEAERNRWRTSRVIIAQGSDKC